MYETIATIAGLVIGVLAGLLAKPAPPAQFSRCCGTTMGCTTCGNGGEVARAAARASQRA